MAVNYRYAKKPAFTPVSAILAAPDPFRTVKSTVKRVIPLAILLFPVLGSAGGTHWSVLVAEVDRIDESNAVISLRNASEQGRDPLQKCEVLIVKADYHSGSIRRRTWSWRITEELHVAALDRLQEFQESATPLDFGYIGNGLLAADREAPCTVEARAIANEHGDLFLAYNESV